MLQRHFNPHSHKGSDRKKVYRFMAITISIHTPTRGVTDNDTCIRCFRDISIHTPTRGVTERRYIDLWQLQFQSTLPQGEWRRTGRQSRKFILISIHTPTRGVTNYPASEWTSTTISIHTPTRGVTQKQQQKIQCSQFQSTLPQGEWPEGCGL